MTETSFNPRSGDPPRDREAHRTDRARRGQIRAGSPV